MKRVEILWTGGFDSTFRISQLSRLDIEIQPFYICNPTRQSKKNELNAIHEMTELFKSMDQTKAKFLPLRIIPMEECHDDESMIQAYRNITKTDFIGNQYIYLCGFSRQHQGIELSVHDNVIDLIQRNGALKRIDDEDIGVYYVVDQSKTHEDLVTIFKDFSFPLVNCTKKDMRAEYKEYGLSEIMHKTWFCHTPIDDKPCGQCNPCKYTIEEGLYKRFDKRALLRYVKRKSRAGLIYRQPRKFGAFVKKECRKYFNSSKKDAKKYKRFIKKDHKKYAKLRKQTSKNFFKFFRQFREDWNDY
ncbi:7-cyano-7-deazaguanine synthase [Methanobrevibacter sp.]|uniref:7-cyano-7-deazaguanine synthase n=1 Tax=Methanobrevibacter sp. TaxID=66852 RepID=UPI0038660CD3